MTLIGVVTTDSRYFCGSRVFIDSDGKFWFAQKHLNYCHQNVSLSALRTQLGAYITPPELIAGL